MKQDHLEQRKSNWCSNHSLFYYREYPKHFIKRRVLLKSVFVHKDARVHYEARTHYLSFCMRHLTESTMNTVLEYVQRNLPEGTALKVSKVSEYVLVKVCKVYL